MEYTFDERCVSDLHKDAFGFRPNHDFWREWELSDNDGKQVIWDSLIEVLRFTNDEDF